MGELKAGPKNGALSEDGQQRWCGGCSRWHGFLCDCPRLGAEVLAQIEAETAELEAKLSNPAWVKAEMARGVSAEKISAWRFFAGLAPIEEILVAGHAEILAAATGGEN